MPVGLLSFTLTWTSNGAKLGETFSSLLSDFYARCQKPKETEDQYADELQVLARKVISICPKQKSQVKKVLKTQFAHQLQDQYFATMAHDFLKVAPPDTTSAKFWADCISIPGTRSKKAVKTTMSTNAAKNYSDKADQPVKSTNHICRGKKKEKIKAQSKMIEWQKKEIENWEAASMKMDPKILIEVMTQAMACMYNTAKDASTKNIWHKTYRGKPYLGRQNNHRLHMFLMVQLIPIWHANTVKILGIDSTTVNSCSIKYRKNSWQLRVLLWKRL